MNDRERLLQFFLAQHACVAIQTVEEEDALAVVRGAAVEANVELWQWSMSRGLFDGLLSNSPPVLNTENPAAALYQLLTQGRPGLAVLLDMAPHLKEPRAQRLLRDLIAQQARRGSMLVLIDAPGAELPAPVRAVATPFELSLPDEAELEQVIKATLRARNEVSRIAVELDRKSFQTMLRNLRGLTARQARQVILDVVTPDRRLGVEDVNAVLAEKRKQFQAAGLLEYVETPVDLAEIGGMNGLKAWLRTREAALSDEAQQFGVPAPRGILMLGVQGAGKSLSAKAVATSWQRPLLRLDVGALYDKFIGESEKRLRDALQQAESMAPIVLWIDEIEKAFASSAAAAGPDGGLSKRMFGSLLTWMQEHAAPVFLIATANEIDTLPPELLRKGRFDEIFFVDLPGLEAREQILSIHLRKRDRDPAQFEMDDLAEACAGFSGAEIEQAIIAGMHEAFAGSQQLSTGHVLRAIRASPPLSVTMAERIEDLRRWAAGRCVSAD